MRVISTATFDRIIEKYSADSDILELLSERSRLCREVDILSKKVFSYKGQLQGLHKFIASKKLMEFEDK